MVHRAGSSARLLAFGILSFADPTFAQPAAPAASSGSPSLTATVRSIDAQAGTLEVVTGVGHVPRVERFSYERGAEVKTAAGPTPLARLKPGDIVRVEYTDAAGRKTARTIELLPRPEAGAVR